MKLSEQERIGIFTVMAFIFGITAIYGLIVGNTHIAFILILLAFVFALILYFIFREQKNEMK